MDFELMQSPTPKKRPWQNQGEHKRKRQERKHLNKKFYNSKAWREFRALYIDRLQHSIHNQVATGSYKEMSISTNQQSKILSLDYPPCERCLLLFLVGAYDTIDKGIELDHINPINPTDAMNSEGWGKPLNMDNLQLLCRRHHAKKSARDNRIIKLKHDLEN